MSEIDLTGLNKAEVLAVLYNASRPLGMGFLHYDPTPMSKEEAETLLASGRGRFDYLKGRVMKIDLSVDILRTDLYDRDNGSGAALKAISSLIAESSVNSDLVMESHKEGVREEAIVTKGRLSEETRSEEGITHLGLKDVKEHLSPAIDRAIDSNKQ